MAMNDLRRHALTGAFKVRLFQLPMVTSRSPSGWLAQATTDVFNCGMECREIARVFPFTGFLWHEEAKVPICELIKLADWFVLSQQTIEETDNA